MRHTLCVLAAAATVACAGDPKDVGALTDSGESGSGGSDDGPASLSSTTVGTTASDGTGTATSTTDGTTDATSDRSDASDSSAGGSSESGGGACACLADEVCTPDGCFGGQVFVNFDGPVIVEGAQDDASIDQSGIMGLGGATSPYGGTPQERAALLEAVRGRFDAVSLWVTDERPSEGDYAMVVLGDNLDDFAPGVLELSILNCDHENPRAVSFAALHVGDGFDDETRATVIAHAIGHSIGLEHVSTVGAIMASAADPLATFTAECQPLAGAAGCDAQHAAACPGGGQDSLAELQALFGAP